MLQSLIQSQNSKLAIAATVLKGVEVGHNLDKSIRLADEFCYGLAEKLSIVHSQTPDLATLLFSKLRPALANVNEANELVGYLTKAGIWDGKEFNQTKLASMATDNLALGKYENTRARLTELVQNLNKVMLADYAEARNNLASEISSSLSGAINTKLTNKVAMPIATGFISSFSDKVAKKLVGDINSEIAKIAGGNGEETLIGGEKNDKLEEEEKGTLLHMSDEELLKAANQVMNNVKYGMTGELLLSKEEVEIVHEFNKRFKSQLADRHIEATSMYISKPLRLFIEKATGVSFGIQDDPLELTSEVVGGSKGAIGKTMDKLTDKSKFVDKSSNIISSKNQMSGKEEPKIVFRPENNIYKANEDLVKYMQGSEMQKLVKLRGTDCSEIAENIFIKSERKGVILELKPKSPNSLQLLENGILTDELFTCHHVYTDGKYVYDPRLSSNPIPKGDWKKLVKQLNPSGITIRKVKK